ncbi:MAG: DNA-processing protein DprA [Actinomycetota bacterium]
MDRAYMAALACLPGMKILSLPRLLELIGGPAELWRILKEGGSRASAIVGGGRAAVWSEACSSMRPMSVLEGLRRRGIEVILPLDEAYPERLAAIYDPPALLFKRGSHLPAQRPSVAVVGSRGASDYGKWASESIAAGLAQKGVVVVSGAAYGVDGHAHQGCIEAGGLTVAVMGCGVDRIYPAGHAELLERIARRGCVVSEFPPGSDPLPWRFPQRNRIIAGICHAVVVVEASEKSGALITADMALEEGREVMAMPGPITSPLCRGTNALIQKGAKLVTCVEDICEELPQRLSDSDGGWSEEAAQEEPQGRERQILALLEQGPRGLDWLAAKTGIPAGELLSVLTSLSIKGRVLGEAGGKYRLLSRV